MGTDRKFWFKNGCFTIPLVSSWQIFRSLFLFWLTLPHQVIYNTAALSEQRSDVKQMNAAIEVIRLNQQLQKFQAKPDFKIRFDQTHI